MNKLMLALALVFAGTAAHAAPKKAPQGIMAPSVGDRIQDIKAATAKPVSAAMLAKFQAASAKSKGFEKLDLTQNPLMRDNTQTAYVPNTKATIKAFGKNTVFIETSGIAGPMVEKVTLKTQIN